MNGSDLTPKHDQLKEKLVHGRCHHGTRSVGNKPDSVGGTLDGQGVCSGHRPSKGQGPGRTDSWTAAASKLENGRKNTSPKTTHRCRRARAETRRATPRQGNAARSTSGTHTYQKHRDHGRRWEGYRAWTPHSRLVGMQNATAALETASPGL